MARKQKPGKFKYGLDAVLKVREIKEIKEQEKFADKQRTYLTEKEKEEALKEQERTRKNELKKMIGGGPIPDFANVLRRQAHLGVLKQDVNKQIQQVIEAQKKLEEQRENLIHSMKDRKIIETDKENRLEDYNKMMKELESKFMDEIATERFKNIHHSS